MPKKIQYYLIAMPKKYLYKNGENVILFYVRSVISGWRGSSDFKAYGATPSCNCLALDHKLQVKFFLKIISHWGTRILF